jgi:hypothetical protein
MPNMANIVAKNAADADVTFNAISPSAGDKVPAQWRAEALGPVPLSRPRFEFTTQYNGQRNVRRANIYLTVPYAVEQADGTTKVVANVPFRVEASLPMGIPDTLVADGAAYLSSLLGSTLIQDSLKSGYAPG